VIIETYAERGVWKNREIGARWWLSAHGPKAVAIEMGRALAAARGVAHVVFDEPCCPQHREPPPNPVPLGSEAVRSDPPD
jgi:hypothetical protein